MPWLLIILGCVVLGGAAIFAEAFKDTRDVPTGWLILVFLVGIVGFLLVDCGGRQSVNEDATKCLQTGGHPVTFDTYRIECVYITPGR